VPRENTVTKFSIQILMIVLILVPLSFSCKDTALLPIDRSFALTIDDASCTELWLKIKIGWANGDRTVTFKRDAMVLFTRTLNDLETIITDTNLLPGHVYHYSAQLDGSSAQLQARTLDSTSHFINWHVDTLGAQGVIRDVYVSSLSNAWAVGQIYLNDSTGNPDMSNPYNAAQWDGSMWHLIKIPVRDFGGSVGIYELYSIIGFNDNDIWFVGDGDLIQWNGSQFAAKAFFATSLPFDGQVRKIWGTDKSNLFCVGRTGSIYHINGNIWTKMTSNTTVDLQDIWGIDATHIWTTGTNVSDGHCIVLQCDGTSWTTIYDNANKPPNEVQGFSSVWTDQTKQIYLTGQSWIRLMNLGDGSFQLLDNQSQWAALRVRGTSRNDIFQVGYGGEGLHFNGVSWYLYPELVSLNAGNAWFYSTFPAKNFILIGGLYLTAYNGAPVVIRGYR
jgi:hypothetical protein